MTTEVLARPVRGWVAVAAVTLGIFALMTSELLPVGLLTPVGAALGVAEGVAGLMVTVPGLVAAVSAPLVTVATGRLDRRLVLGLLVGLVGAANLMSAFATSFTVVLVARFLIGISVGGFWSVAGGIALRLVPSHHVPRATAVIFAGVETASVLGVPAGTLLGDHAGWRTAFAAVGVLGLVALAAIVLLTPALPPSRTLRLIDLPAVLRGVRGLRAALTATFLIITGHFTAYTFVRPVLLADGVSAPMVGVLLLVFGVAGICGNVVAGALIHGRIRAAVVLIATALAVAMVAPGGPGWLILWGLAYGAVPVTLQTWVLTAAPAATEAASALFVSVFNASIALGALLGGLAVDRLPLTGVLLIGAALSLLTLTVARRAPDR
ncbi:MFS transporter [Actinoplanes lobatus]|uniref:MFS transporter n=1 Tax=Actinoplanes lobatus TaxID=113568 RepID=A0A7W7HJB6_9ACTN|nr:MFS transporter [Actinoplanes lobatus]MBB4751586.1 putative MFS family arabinose efflux permease [Actinoplanes lobatus]GGN64837.1 MFS transporter [Actinoplanes lobatus]GIE43170.1 MFS transporter [Actinoplanes lobatus]